MNIGWVAVVAGGVVAGASVYKLASSTPDSTMDTPWYVPQRVEDYINDKAANIQQEQKALVERGIIRAFARGLLVMGGVSIVLVALKAQPRSSG